MDTGTENPKEKKHTQKHQVKNKQNTRMHALTQVAHKSHTNDTFPHPLPLPPLLFPVHFRTYNRVTARVSKEDGAGDSPALASELLAGACSGLYVLTHITANAQQCTRTGVNSWPRTPWMPSRRDCSSLLPRYTYTKLKRLRRDNNCQKPTVVVSKPVTEMLSRRTG